MAKIVKSDSLKRFKRKRAAPIPEMEMPPVVAIHPKSPSPARSNQSKKAKTDPESEPEVRIKDFSAQKSTKPELSYTAMTMEEATNKYPILKNEDLVKRFLAVPMTNNQKGRIRQVLRDNLKSASSETDPEVINHRITSLLQNSVHLTDSDLRKIRVLHNMLRTATKKQNESNAAPKKLNKKKKSKNKNSDLLKNKVKHTDETKKGDETNDEFTNKDDVLKKNKHGKNLKIKKEGNSDDSQNKGENDELQKAEESKGKHGGELKVITEVDDEAESAEDEKKDAAVSEKVKVKGPKRYVVFVGNLPYDIDKDGIMRHFSSIVGSIKDVRIPKRGENKKGGMAYLELNNESSYQMALSKHHSMMGSRRINVLYTATGKGKVDKSGAKSKSAKLVALQKAGKLLGSVPMNRKRSFRRKKQREALARSQSQN